MNTDHAEKVIAAFKTAPHTVKMNDPVTGMWREADECLLTSSPLCQLNDPEIWKVVTPPRERWVNFYEDGSESWHASEKEAETYADERAKSRHPIVHTGPTAIAVHFREVVK